MRSTEYLPVFEATRGNLVESLHLGAFAVVDQQRQPGRKLGRPGFNHLPSISIQTIPGIAIYGK